MKHFLIALLLAGAAWAQEFTDWDITTFGMDNGFMVLSTRDWYHIVEGPTYLQVDSGDAILIIPEGETYNYVIKTEHYEFQVDSLTNIKPTPEEMENGRQTKMG